MGYLRAHALSKGGGLSGKGGKLKSTSASRPDIAPLRQSWSIRLGKNLPECFECEAEKKFVQVGGILLQGL